MELEHLLRESVYRYRALLHVQGEVNEALKKARPDEIKALAEELESLQGEARRVDRSLMPLLLRKGEAIAALPLFQERQGLLEECARQIRLIIPAAEAVKAVLGEELLQTRAGRTALAGYGSGGRNQGVRMIAQV